MNAVEGPDQEQTPGHGGLSRAMAGRAAAAAKAPRVMADLGLDAREAAGRAWGEGAAYGGPGINLPNGLHIYSLPH